MTVSVHHGDSREVLKGIADGTFDSVVCDPPYALVSIGKRFGADNAAPAKAGKSGAYARASAGFMGKRWDTGETAFDPEFWAEVYRTMKPGAHLIAFSGTRTYHRLACAIEDAGFEMRDMIAWLYGSGFPKSHDVSKGIAKRRVEDVEPVRVVCRFIRAAMDAQGLKSKDLVQHFGDCNPRLIDHWAARDTDSQPSTPTLDQWTILVGALSLDRIKGCKGISAEVARLNARKGSHGERWADAEVIGEVTVASPGFADLRFDGDRTVRALDAEAAQWEGWGTALKPALEPIVLARKPLAGTVAANVLAHGTGALNIDASRIHANDAKATAYTIKRTAPGATQNATGRTKQEGVTYDGMTKDGRWPANVIHDGSDEVVEAFPDTVSGSRAAGRYGGMGYHGVDDWPMPGVDGDGGSAARFFYSAKADAADRCGSKHPTVKPVDLMAYLCRLATRPGGLVLDPFAGSGSTGMACLREGFDCVLIEREAEYVADINRRLQHVEGADTPLFAQAVAEPTLFDGEAA